MLTNITKYAKLITTTIGALLILLNEVTPFVPADDKHWVTGIVAVLTLVVRDLSEVFGGTSDVSAKAPTAPAAPPAA